MPSTNPCPFSRPPQSLRSAKDEAVKDADVAREAQRRAEERMRAEAARVAAAMDSAEERHRVGMAEMAEVRAGLACGAGGAIASGERHRAGAWGGLSVIMSRARSGSYLRTMRAL